MKKILIASAAICFAATSAMAAQAKVAGAKPKTTLETGATGAKITGKSGVSTSTARTNMGAASKVGAAADGNVLSQAAGAALGAKLNGPSCDSDSVASLLNGAQFVVIAKAKEQGLTGSTCFEKFKGSDVTIANRIQNIAGAFSAEFDGMVKSGLISDVNGDKKVNVLDATDAQKARILAKGADVIEQDLNISEGVDRLEATKQNGCDIVGAGLGTDGAFAAARAL